MKKTLMMMALLALSVTAWAANTKTRVTQVTDTVTVSDDVDYIITGDTPFGDSGVVDITNREHAVLIIEAVKPSAALSLLNKHVRIGGQVARNNSNCQVKMYAQQGCMIYPYASTLKPLTTFTEPDFQGDSCNNYGLENTGGYMNTLTDAKLNNKIRSFRLKRGYMVTFSTLPQGYGYQRIYIAQDADVEVNSLPAVLDGRISSYRVFKWNTAGKAGLASNTDATAVKAVNAISCYDWGTGRDLGIDAECVPNHIYEDWPSSAACGAVTYSPHMKTNNEPRNSADDHPQTLDEILANWQNLMRTGMRLCSPSSWDGSDYVGNASGFLRQFFDSIDARGWRCDIIDLHCYWAEGTFNSIINWVNAVHRPVWISEWVWGASWNNNGAFASGVTEAQNAEAVQRICNRLNGWDYIERYFYWNSERDPSRIYKNGALTAAGRNYAKMKTSVGYNGKYDYVPKAPTMYAPVHKSVTWADGKATVKWHDYNGEYNTLMEIQRKVRGQQWQVLDTLEIKEKASDYSYTDENAVAYASYRVHIIDMNGQEYYTNEDMQPGDAVQCADGQTRYLGGNLLPNGDFHNGTAGWTNGAGKELGQPWFEVMPRGNTGRNSLIALGNKGQNDAASVRTFCKIEPHQQYCFRVNVRNAGTFIKVDLTDDANQAETNVVTAKSSTTWSRQTFTFDSGDNTQAILAFRWLGAKAEIGDVELCRVFNSREDAVADGIACLQANATAAASGYDRIPALYDELKQRIAAVNSVDDTALAIYETAVDELRQAMNCQAQTDSLLQVIATASHMMFSNRDELLQAVEAAQTAATAQDVISANAQLREAWDAFLPMTNAATQPTSPSFASTTGWETIVGTYKGGDQRTATKGGKTCWNAWWSGITATLGTKRTMEIRQTVEQLPSGLYELQCKATTEHYCLSDQHGYMVVGGDTVRTPQLTADYMDMPGINDFWQTLTTQPVYVPQDSSITIGFVGSKQGATDNAWHEVGNASSTGDRREGWWCATDFRLLFHPLYKFDVTPGQFNTICLPYSYALPEGYHIYRIAGLMADYKWLALEEVTEPDAGRPYIYTCADSEATFYPVGQPRNSAQNTNNNNLRGQFAVPATRTTTSNPYVLRDGVWQRIEGRDRAWSFSAYITKCEDMPVLNEWTGMKMPIQGVESELGDPAGIGSVNDEAASAIRARYDLGGRKVQKEQSRGINIDVMQDGSQRKVIVK